MLEAAHYDEAAVLEQGKAEMEAEMAVKMAETSRNDWDNLVALHCSRSEVDMYLLFPLQPPVSASFRCFCFAICPCPLYCGQQLAVYLVMSTCAHPVNLVKCGLVKQIELPCSP